VQDEPLGSQRGLGHRLGQRDRARDDDRLAVRRPPAAVRRERVERPDPQPDQVRRRCQVRLVAGAARGVVADPARREVGAERAGEVASADIVGGDDQGRPVIQALLRVEQRREQVGPDRAGGAQVDRLAGPNPGREA
jgi:hypothetical protein